MIAGLVGNFQYFFLIFVRIVAMVEVAPLLNSRAIPQIAKIGLALFIAIAVFPWVSRYPIPQNAVDYFLLVLGEVLLGIITGFVLVLIFAAFQVAGQFFSLQMGFGASQVFDPLAQIQIPLMGQFLNIVAMLVFLTISGFHKLLLVGVYQSLGAVRAIDLVTGRSVLMSLFLRSLGKLFSSALTIAFPVLGCLLLVSVTMGLLAKAAPQMNLLMLGFPIAIGVAYLVLILSMPFLVAAFVRIIENGLDSLTVLFGEIGSGSRSLGAPGGVR